MISARRGVILPVVLLVLALLGLLVAMFSFRVYADVAATQANFERLQTRLAAEAGIERVKLMLRNRPFDTNAWYHNPDELHRIIVWMHDGDETVWGTNDEFNNPGMTYRFSIVADDPLDDEHYVRFGVTDESAKLNLNTATQRQLMILVRAVVGDSDEVDPLDIVDAILDWRDADTSPRSPERDTEGSYYRRLPSPYRVRNGPFDTVEELLLVKGVTGQILYGEDFDRNGLLTDNEDDGDEHFPPDNEDGMLNRGLYPYLTVLSTEDNVGMDNRARVYLRGDEEAVRSELELIFPDEPGVVSFILVAARAEQPTDDSNTGNEGGAGGDSEGEGDDETGSDETGGEDDESEGSAGADSQGDGAEPDGEPGKVIRSPASLLRSESPTGQRTRINNPLTLEHLPALLDRTTMISPEQRSIPGLININTAPRLVLRCIDRLTAEQIDEIIAVRASLPSEDKETTAWLVTEEIVDLETFERVAPYITARGQQFMIESLGYGDHIGMVTRLQVVVDAVGPIVQTIYYRDLTELSGHYPIREEDLERLGIH